MLRLFLSLTAAGAASAYTLVGAPVLMFKNIDPIVHPGTYSTHMHTIFGSDAITANTTTSAQLQAGCTGAGNPNDLSAYWVPTLYLTNAGPDYTPIAPEEFEAYYENESDAEIALPQDFTMVVGNPENQDAAGMDSSNGISWFCENDAAEDKPAAAFPTTTCSTHLQTLLYFNDCVDPTTLNSTYSSSSYGNTNWCPDDMKRVPRLRFSIRYNLRGILKDGWSGPPPLILSCGTSYCSHGDFFNGWLPEAATNMLAATSGFSSISGPRGGAYAPAPDCTPKDADPDHGTSDYLISVEMGAPNLTSLVAGGPPTSAETGGNTTSAPAVSSMTSAAAMSESTSVSVSISMGGNMTAVAAVSASTAVAAESMPVSVSAESMPASASAWSMPAGASAWSMPASASAGSTPTGAPSECNSTSYSMKDKQRRRAIVRRAHLQ